MAQTYDVLVVHKIDRFARKLRITLEYFEKLGKAGVGFVSMQEQIDYTTPQGKLMLVMQGGLAEFYSENLSQETKKGMIERRAQGLYLGPLPFGTMKGDDGVPMPNPDTYPGLLLAFQNAAAGDSDREVARDLNSKGFRTVGPSGNHPFSNDSVRGVLTNRFYVGYLPDGKGGWIKAKHGALVEQELWEQAQETRRRHRHFTHASRPTGRRLGSLSGLGHCWYCKGRIHTLYVQQGEPRLGCHNRQKGWDCPQKSATLSVYEQQILAYLSTFHIPEDYQERIWEAHRKLETAYCDTEQEKAKLDGKLKRARELYQWGDYTREEYQARKDSILKELEELTPKQNGAEHLDKLAQFLADVPSAWEAATQEQRNKLARTLFDQVWLQDKAVVAVKPRPELEPFFRLTRIHRRTPMDGVRTAEGGG